MTGHKLRERPPEETEVTLEKPIDIGRPWILCSTVLPLIAAYLGLRWNWPWLVAEHQRLQPWMILCDWLAPIVALFWYLQFMVACALFLPCESETVQLPEHSRWFWALAITFGVSLAAESGTILLSIHKEHRAFSRARAAASNVVAGVRKPLSGGREMYTITCRFQDANGNWHDSLQFPHPGDLPLAVKQAITAQRFPAALPILYDADWPGRVWIQGTRDPHYNRMYFMSGSVALFSGLVGFALIALKQRYPSKMLPSDRVCPFLAVSLVLFLAGLGKLILGEV
jgi:hypothetical protein